MNEKLLKKIVEYTSFFTALFLILEAVKIISYYWLWGFNIIPYLTVSFYFSQFVGDIGLALSIILLFVCIPAIGIIITLLTPKRKSIIFYLQFIFIVFAIPFLLSWGLIEVLSNNELAVSIGIILLITLLFTFEHIIEVPVYDNITLKKRIELISQWFEKEVGSSDSIPTDIEEYPKRKIVDVILFIFIISFVSVSAYTNISKHYRLLNNKQSRNTEIIFEDSTKIAVQSNEFLIGNTPDFYFTYDDSINTVRVVKAENIKEIKVKQ